ncbi:S9 family peptidase [uncultured Draconibacterium sp.]|uniref:S9 family peptidase n=1 Tax=uncultured Draconibacterium sp. TaxID=1573823 RepID=UPI003260BF50
MRHLIVLIFLFISTVVFAQTKQMSLEDAVYGRYTYLRPAGLSGLQWQNDKQFTYIENRELLAEQVKTGAKSKLISLDELNAITGDEMSRIPAYRWLNPSELLLTTAMNFYVVNPVEKTAYSVDLIENAENAVFNAESKFASFTRENDVWIAFENGNYKQITTDGGSGIVNGQSVHRNEFGISGGLFNSPKGSFVAFYRKDETMVKDYPLVDYMARQAEHKPVKYPMAGMNSHHVTLGVYNIATQSTVFLKTGEPFDHYLTNVAWSPDEKYIYLAELNRAQNHMQLNCYDAFTGEKVKTLFEEQAETYVEPLHPIHFSSVNANEFYYLSRRDGWFHVYKYNTDGNLLKQLTKGEWEVTNILGFDSKENTLFIEATIDDPLQKKVCKVNVKTGAVEKLTSESGMHAGVLSPGANYILDRWSGTNVPGKVDLLSVKGDVLRTVFEADDPLKDYELGENRLVSIKTKDGKHDLHGRIILPVDFDPAKKYPVVVYVYGGPHSQLVNKGWHNQARWWQYYMASKGYIAFTLDNRGTNNRGRDFETAIHRQLGVLETEDQMQGIEYLTTLPYVDTERIGVHGWSYGGFMTLNLKLKHPDVFKVAVAGGPVVDWSMYEIMYGERYMDRPYENPEGYKNSDMSNYVENLDGKLMLIHGVQDATVVMQHSMKFLRECVKQNKQVDFFAYPVHPHNVRGKDRVHLMEKVSLYFFENL